MPREPVPLQPGPKSQGSSSAAATGRMAKLVRGGADATRMVNAVAAILEEWLAQGMAANEMRELLEQLQADLDGGVDAVENAEADAETDGQRRAAAAQKGALAAARDAVAQALEKLAG